MNQLLDSRVLPARRTLAIIAVGIILAFSQAAVAAPMRCSGEQTICINSCKKNPDRSTLSICITNCGVRQTACMKNGCWNSGMQKYCGLLKQ
ncbi:MAG TPA: hypothetical protein VEC94_13185 [Pseudolabrys sp.]|nr:hypothetical protein [Pseudolabrys sp.]